MSACDQLVFTDSGFHAGPVDETSNQLPDILCVIQVGTYLIIIIIIIIIIILGVGYWIHWINATPIHIFILGCLFYFPFHL